MALPPNGKSSAVASERRHLIEQNATCSEAATRQCWRSAIVCQRDMRSRSLTSLGLKSVCWHSLQDRLASGDGSSTTSEFSDAIKENLLAIRRYIKALHSEYAMQAAELP